ncbi:MAG: class I SAM-dependent methyltransferase [Candidatus Cardinium sp.]|nr:class I SAM-dependent methyltransferase [Candidatus Cardinium sp.]
MPWLNPVLAHYIIRKFAQNASTIVDMGVGPGYLVMELAKLTSARIVGLDYNVNMLQVAQETLLEHGINTIQVDLQLENVHNLSLADHSVDCVVSYSCFHHWSDPVQGLKECMRILKEGGVLVLLDLIPLEEHVLADLQETITDQAVYAIIKKAVLESYSLEQVEQIVQRAGISSYSIGNAIFPQEDLMAHIDLLFEENLFKNHTGNEVLSWQLIVNK